MKDKKMVYEEKLKRIQLIRERLPLEDSIFYSLDDLKDAYLETKAKILQDRIDLLTSKLSSLDKEDCHYLYRELEDLEEMLCLLEKKYSKTYKKAKRFQKKTSTSN